MSVGDEAFRINTDHAGGAQRQARARALPHSGKVAEVEGRSDVQRRLADCGEGHFVALNAVVSPAITAAQHRLLSSEDIPGKPERRPILQASILDAARIVTVLGTLLSVERIARSRHDAPDQI